MSHERSTESLVLRDASDVEEIVAASVWPKQTQPDLFGIEVEAFPLIIDNQGPAGRLPLQKGDPNVLEVVGDIAGSSRQILDNLPGELGFSTGAGGRITFEPGAQIEHSSAPGRSSTAVRQEMDAVWGELRDAFWEHRVCLLSLGVDPWNETSDIPQQLTSGRYVAMAEYLAARSGAGAQMMRNTCSVQVNLDAGNGKTRRERWLASHLMSPILTAMFATSPGPLAVSRRAQVWQQMDPTRTGFPVWGKATDADPLADTLEQALGADVMFITRNGATSPGRPGWSLRDWLTDGHPTAGALTSEDLETHLTTLFTEVRPRGGVLEMRGIDGLTQAWWHVPLVTVASLLYDEGSRSRVIELLEPLAPRLNATWYRAAAVGLADPELASIAAALASLAVEAATKDPACFDPADVSDATSYFEQFTMRGLSPADLLAGKLNDPPAALAWAAPEHATKGAA